jgi:hypothetical protein
MDTLNQLKNKFVKGYAYGLLFYLPLKVILSLVDCFDGNCFFTICLDINCFYQINLIHILGEWMLMGILWGFFALLPWGKFVLNEVNSLFKSDS